MAYSYWSPEACAELLELWRFDSDLSQPADKLAAYVPFWGGFDSLALGDELVAILSGEAGGLQLVSGSLGEPADMADSPCEE